MKVTDLVRYEVTFAECQMILESAKRGEHFRNCWRFLNHKRAENKPSAIAPINRNWFYQFLSENGCKGLPQTVSGFVMPKVLPKAEIQEEEQIDTVKDEDLEIPKPESNEDYDPKSLLSKAALRALHVFYRLGEVSNLVLKQYMNVGYGTAFLILAELEYQGIVEKKDGPKGRYHFLYNESQLRTMFPEQFRCSYREMDWDYMQEELQIREQQDAAMREAGYEFDDNDYRWLSPEEIKERRLRIAAEKRHATWERKHAEAKKSLEDDLEQRFTAFVAIIRSQPDVDSYVRSLLIKGPNPFINRMLNLGILIERGWHYEFA